MRYTPKLAAAAAIWLGLGLVCCPGQTNPATTAEGTRIGKVVLPDAPAPSDGVTPVLRPKVPERQDLPPEVIDKIKKFERDRQAYLDREQALKKQLQGANDQERARVRAQLKLAREQWLERSRQSREEFRDRAREIKEKLADHREVIDSAQEPGRDSHNNRDRQ
jgi:hypothetical protein